MSKHNTNITKVDLECEIIFVLKMNYGFFAPLPVRPLGYSPLARSPPGSFAPWLVRPLADSHPGFFAPGFVRPLPDSPLALLSSGLFAPR